METVCACWPYSSLPGCLVLVYHRGEGGASFQQKDLNIFLLLGVSLVPFSAGLMGRYPGQQIAVVLYGSNLLFCLAFHVGMWWHATRENHLVDADLDPRIVNFGVRLGLFPIIGYGIAIAVSFVSPWASMVLYALVPLPYILGLFYRRMGRVIRSGKEDAVPVGERESESG